MGKEEKGKSFWASDLIFWAWSDDVVRSKPGKADIWWNGNDVNCSFSRSSSSLCCCANESDASCGGDSSRYLVGGDRWKSSLCLSSSNSECGVEFDWTEKEKKNKVEIFYVQDFIVLWSRQPNIKREKIFMTQQYIKNYVIFLWATTILRQCFIKDITERRGKICEGRISKWYFFSNSCNRH